MKRFSEPLLAKITRALGGEDTRPPKNWPFPTWKGKLIADVADDGPPPPKRRGPKTKKGTGDALTD